MDLLPLRQALDDLDSEISQAEVERTAAETKLRRCEERLATLQAERSGIESYIRRHEGDQVSATPMVVVSGMGDRAMVSMPRTDAVAHVLAKAGQPMTPNDIREALVVAGREDSYRDVAAALSHLKARDRAINVARGLWALSTEAFEEDQAEASDPYDPWTPEDADYVPPPDDDYDDGYFDLLDQSAPPADDKEDEDPHFR